MERIEFCAMLEKAKHDTGHSTVDIVRGLGMYNNSVRSLERGVHSPRLSTCLSYLGVIDCKLRMQHEEKIFDVSLYEDCISCLFEMMGGNTTKSIKINEDAHLYDSYIKKMKSKGTSVTLDKFLTIVNALNCKLSVVYGRE